MLQRGRVDDEVGVAAQVARPARVRARCRREPGRRPAADAAGARSRTGGPARRRSPRGTAHARASRRGLAAASSAPLQRRRRTSRLRTSTDDRDPGHRDRHRRPSSSTIVGSRPGGRLSTTNQPRSSSDVGCRAPPGAGHAGDQDELRRRAFGHTPLTPVRSASCPHDAFAGCGAVGRVRLASLSSSRISPVAVLIAGRHGAPARSAATTASAVRAPDAGHLGHLVDGRPPKPLERAEPPEQCLAPGLPQAWHAVERARRSSPSTACCRWNVIANRCASSRTRCSR